MLRHLIRVVLLGLLAAGLSAGFSAPTSAGTTEPNSAAQVEGTQECAAERQLALLASEGSFWAKRAIRPLKQKVKRTKKKITKLKKKQRATKTKKRTKRLKELRHRKEHRVNKLRRAKKTLQQAKAATRKAVRAHEACLNAPLVVTGPVSGGLHDFPATATGVDVAALGYEEREYFLRGTATAYERDGAWTSAGEWAVTEGDTAPYRTRLLVRAPKDPADFNGTVIVEWLNVSGNSDADVDWPWMHTEITRNGYAWVGVSAQSVGVNSKGQEGHTIAPTVMGLKNWDPERYASLIHPGDRFSYDIFSQAGQALLGSAGVDPLPGMEVSQMIATGQSQSGFRMITYANAIQPVAEVYDGIIIHARSGVNAPLGDGIQVSERDGEDGPENPTPVRVRTDLDVPVMQLVSESELFETGSGGLATKFVNARQPDTDMIRTWEMAGTAHSDRYLTTLMNSMYQRMFVGARDLGPVLEYMNDGPQAEISSAALRAMNKWILDGSQPGSAEPIATADGAILRDDRGNAIGGVRTPAVDVPTAALAAGTTRFTPEQLHTMYGSHTNYVQLFTAAADEAVEGGFLLPEDRDRLVDAAEASSAGDPVSD